MKDVKRIMPKKDANELVYANIMYAYRGTIASGWLYDNKNALGDQGGNTKYFMEDKSNDASTGMYRDFDEVSDGILIADVYVSFATENDGMYIAFEDATENKYLTVGTKNGKFFFEGENRVETDIEIAKTEKTDYVFRFELDLVENKARVFLNGNSYPAIELKNNISISRLAVGTTKEGSGSYAVIEVHVCENYACAERFLALDSMSGKQLYNMEVEGKVTIEEFVNETRSKDKFSAKIDAKACTENKASKSFPALDGDAIYEALVLLPTGDDGGYFALYSEDKEVIRIESKNNTWVCGNTVLRKFTTNVWQTLRLETDYDENLIKVRVCGQNVGKIPFNGEAIDSLTIGFTPKEDAVMWFDDVVAYRNNKHDDYPSKPVPSNNKGYNIGVHMCDLWRDADSGEGWAWASPFPDLEPVLGYYDEGLPEVADWEIKQMVEHGITFQHVCWYPPVYMANKALKMTHNGGRHIQAFQNAKYSDMMKYAIIYVNEDYDRRFQSFESFKNYIWAYWKENFFSDPRYLVIDNKPFMSMIAVSAFIDAMGGDEGAKKCIEFMREDIKTLGFDDIIIVNTATPEDGARYMNLGFDGRVDYNFGKYGYMPEYQISKLEKLKQYDIYTIPSVSIGFNDVGRAGTRSPIITPEDHRTVAKYIRDDYLATREKTGDWKDNMLFISTWNEYTEGTYVAPAQPHGYGYLDSIREVFTNETSSPESIDVYLTKAQKDRISKLHPDTNQPLRIQMLPEFAKNEVEQSEKELVAIWDFENTEKENVDECQKWHAFVNCEVTYEKGKALHVDSDRFDPSYRIDDIDFDTTKVHFLHIRMKTRVSSVMEIYYATDLEPQTEWIRKYAQAQLISSGEYEDYWFPLYNTPGWKGKLISIRVDPFLDEGECDVALIELLGARRKATVKVNNAQMRFNYLPLITNDGDVRLTANPRIGFFSMLGLYYVWNRFDGKGKLMVESKQHRAYFNVGSDICILDGKEVKLKQKFELLDGLPVFYLKEFCVLFGYEVVVDGNNYSITGL